MAGQAVRHWHVHVIPKYMKGEGFQFSSIPSKDMEDLDDVYEILKTGKAKQAKMEEKAKK